MGSYCCLRLSKVLVHQEVAFINRTDAKRHGRAICYCIQQNIGHGSFVESGNYNKIRAPGLAVRIVKGIYYPLVKLEVSFWKTRRPEEVLESGCQQ